MITYVFIKILSDLPEIFCISIGSAIAVTIILCIYLFAKGYRPSKEGFYKALDKLEKERQEKREKDKAYHEYFKAHKPYPWKAWKD